MSDASGDLGADLSDLHELLLRSSHDRGQIAEMISQQLGGGFTHMANPQSRQAARQRRVLTALKRVYKILS